jgi:limonene 1,2-monooxygenase
VSAGERRETLEYFEYTLGRPPGRSDDPLREGVQMGTTLVGSPETVIRGINRLVDYSQGGFGGLLIMGHEWASREQQWRSFELFARYVMPVFQHSVDLPAESNVWARENRATLFGATPEAMKRAFTDFGKEAPKDITQRSFGGLDVEKKS